MNKEIVILSRSLPYHGLGGMEVVAWDLARECARQGWAVRVITTSLPDYNMPFEDSGVLVVPLVNTPSGRYSRLWWIESRRYFLEHCMGSTQGVISVSAAAYGLLPLKKKLHDVPFVLQAHGTSIGEIVSKWRSKRWRSYLTSIRNFFYLPNELLAYRKYDAVVAVGERVYRDLTSAPIRWFLNPDQVGLINNGIDTSLFSFSEKKRVDLRQKLNLSASAPVLISASRLHVQKGVSKVLRVFAQLQAQLPEATLLIAGDGPERNRLISLAEKLGVSGKVFFLGPLSREQLADYLSAADAFVFLTIHLEVGLTLNVLEALSSGLPCVVSDHLNLPSSPMINLVSPTDDESTAKLLEALLNDHSVKKRACALSEQYELGKATKGYLDLITEVAKEKARGA